MRVKGVTDVRQRPPDKRLVLLEARPTKDQTSTRATRALHAVLARLGATGATHMDQHASDTVEPLVTAALRPLCGWGGVALHYETIRVAGTKNRGQTDDHFCLR